MVFSMIEDHDTDNGYRVLCLCGQQYPSYDLWDEHRKMKEE